MCSSMNEFYEIANFMNTWSQQHNNYTNLLLTGYECKPVKSACDHNGGSFLTLFYAEFSSFSIHVRNTILAMFSSTDRMTLGGCKIFISVICLAFIFRNSGFYCQSDMIRHINFNRLVKWGSSGKFFK